MALPADQWCEAMAGSYSEFNDVIEEISTIAPYPVGVPSGPVPPSRYLWRGQGCRTWGLHTKLARDFHAVHGRHGDESDVQTMERRIWSEAVQWDLDWRREGGRLSFLELLAALQHHGAPTRLLDVTSSPHVALWFAVQQSKYQECDARVFAVDVSQCKPMPRPSNPEPAWPWATGTSTGADPFTVWQPPPLEARIDRQMGAFLLGPVPGDEQEREHQSLSMTFADLGFIKSDKVRKGQPPAHIVIRIPAQAKGTIIERLERLHGLTAARLFPDAAGFANHGQQARQENPPPGPPW